jgi:4-amino-4-deoxy-L-arabinose transferase-like glycosyltransferase
MSLRAWLRSPLFALLVVVAVVHAIGLTWWLPASDGWDDDGIAPRDFLVGVVRTYAPGQHFTYPPVHLLLLAVLNLPAIVVSALKAPSLAPGALVSEFIQVPIMTTFAVVARVVAVLMSLGIVVTLAKIGEELRSPRAGLWAAATVGVNWSFAYYAHTSNLDVPYNFWACLALLFLVRAIARREPRLLRKAAVLAALAVGTKDQAYAIFLLSAPVALASWTFIDPTMRARRGEVARESAIAAGIAVGLLALVDGAVTNPRGFADRVRFLLGPASQDHAEYGTGWRDAVRVIGDALGHFTWYYPLVFAPFVVAGVAVALQGARRDPSRALAAMLPLLAAISFTLAFDCTARRTEHRFVLPQSLFVAVYAGLAWDAALTWLAARRLRILGAITAA